MFALTELHLRCVFYMHEFFCLYILSVFLQRHVRILNRQGKHATKDMAERDWINVYS